MRRIPLYRWIPERDENLGDYLSVPLLRALGFEAVPPTPGQPVMTAVGSILHPDHYARPASPRWVVWGTGIGNGDRPPDGVCLDFRAVRGPMTRRLFHLPDSVPLGDPALLLPTLYPRFRCDDEQRKQAPVLFVNHIGTDPLNKPEGCDCAVSARTSPENVLDLVHKIASAKFVASESLHGCMVAAAYGVPWAPCSPRPEWRWCQIPTVSKWSDWFEYLGLPHQHSFPKSVAAAMFWWKMIGGKAKLASTDGLLRVFPGDIT